MDSLQRLETLGIRIPEICLPREGIDLTKWAVIACDQFTQDAQYWEAAKQIAGAAPSALNLILPEIYLGEKDLEQRIAAIRQEMAAYIASGILAAPKQGAIYVERETPFHPRRRGLLLAVDLERYDWKPDSRLLLRATEDTVPERLPPRMAIRRDAPLEIPHILLLIDDRDDSLLPAIADAACAKPPLYQTTLMLNGGSISGWGVDGESQWGQLAQGLETLARQAQERYCADAGESPFLFAVGDGNHSLAAAKAVWEEYKACHPLEANLERHPARWALAELVNLYDPGLAFEPIHRILFGPQAQELLECFSRPNSGGLPGFSYRRVDSAAELSRLVNSQGQQRSGIGLIAGGDHILMETTMRDLPVSLLQPPLDALIQRNPEYEIDYIHGEEELLRLTGPSQRCLGLLLPPVAKEGLFETVAHSGPLPRKSFSMGAGIEKRYYLECRRLFGSEKSLD